MNSVETFEHIWLKVKPLLLPYEGSASQLYVLDLPLSCLEKTINEFCKRAHNPVISTLGGYTFAKDDAPICDVTSRAKMFEACKQNLQSVINGQLFNDRSLSLWIWPDYVQKTFDAEFVFWAGEFFPNGMKESDCVNSFGSVYSLAELIRKTHPSSACVFSSREVGDPRKDKNKPHTIYW